jgi:hypothetical protein
MYLRISDGFGQPPKPPTQKRRRKGPLTPQPKVAAPQPKVPADRLIYVIAGWRLNIPFREDFAAFRQDTANAVARHNAKATIDDLQERKLKAIHDDMKRQSPKLNEFDIVTVRAAIHFLKGPRSESHVAEFCPSAFSLIPSLCSRQ